MKPGPLDQPKKYEYWIKNGHVIDTSQDINKNMDILISKSRIIDFPNEGKIDESDVRFIIDARGCDVLPGLIDFHGHFAWMNSAESCAPDTYEFPNGVTSACDGGTMGSSGFEGFLRSTMLQSELTLMALVNVASGGMATKKYVENINPENFDQNALEYLFERYPEYILGLKIRLGKGFSDGMGLWPLISGINLAERFDTMIAVHPTYSLEPVSDIVGILRKGDILCHPFQAMGEHSILDENGKVLDEVWEAKKRGVVFDCAHGRINFSLFVAQKAVSQGFLPDVISTDLSMLNIYQRNVFSLPMVMMRMIAAGMSYKEVIKACTTTPAKLMGKSDIIGTLKKGALADVCIMKKQERQIELDDLYGNKVTGNTVLVPQMTIKAGKVKYCSMDFVI